MIGDRSSHGEKTLLRVVEQALEVESSARSGWLDAHCPAALKTKALRMCEMAEEVGDDDDLHFAVPVHPVDLAGTEVGSYRMVSLLGEGGMGRVYLAERSDGAFERRVAIKVIRASVVESRTVTQFQIERQVLSDLTHPNIATLLDGGTTKDGLPYVVMELIDGDPLNIFTQERSMSVRDRIKVMLDVCAAVQYAHAALIVHRDIKPNNILVDTEGRPKLLDFGIAQSLNKPDLNVPAAQLHTPAYASPEQLTGGKLTTATDIYSLGVVLYEVLSGERPFRSKEDSPAGFVQAVATGPVEPPSVRSGRLGRAKDSRTIRGDLDAIVLKALALSSDARYATAAELADDLRRFLEGLPVNARGRSIGYRFRRFVARHRIVVATAALAMLGLLTAFVVTFMQYRDAVAARASADLRFAQAWELGRQVFGEVYDELAAVQGTLPVRTNLARVGVDYLDQLNVGSLDPDQLLLDLGTQYTRLADVHSGLGIANIGEPKTGKTLLLKAEGLLAAYLDRRPFDAEGLTEMVWVKRLLTNHVLTYEMNTAEAERHARQGLAIAEDGLRSGSPRNWRLEARKWNARADLTKVLGWQEKYTEALSLLDTYIEELDNAELKANLRKYDSKLAYLRGLRGELYADSGRDAQALTDLAFARDHYVDLRQSQQQSTYLAIQSIRFCGLLSMSYARLEQWEPAVRNARQATELAQQMAAADPMDLGGRRNLATQQQGLAQALAGAGETQEALSVITNVVKTYRRLAREQPDNPSARRDLADALTVAGEVAGAGGVREQACQALGDAVEIWNELERDKRLTAFDATKGARRTATEIRRICGDAP